MNIRFLLGPSGTGKTRRCLDEIRQELVRRPDGPPLLFLAPKQATFQLERQLLGTGDLRGFTRLFILSFDRLARFLLDQTRAVPRRLLNAEGRQMLLRALINREREQLQIFRAAPRLRGFAAQLSEQIRELHEHQVTPDQLRELAERASFPRSLRAKLHDLAVLSRAYHSWLDEHGIEDQDRLLDLAAAAVSGAGPEPDSRAAPTIDALWMDGFSDLSPQEASLLLAVLPLCRKATLAFNLDHAPAQTSSWLSTWFGISKTVGQLRARIADQFKVEPVVTHLERSPECGRFAGRPRLFHLERHWNAPAPFSAAASGPDQGSPSEIELIECEHPEHEAEAAAVAVLNHVRAGGRYNEIAVLVRSLDPYRHPIRRAFLEHQIPFFLDRREPAAHLPLVELTRNALRTVAFDWEHDDWINLLKTGSFMEHAADVDRLENEALARGWTRAEWLRSGGHAGSADRQLEKLRARIVEPLVRLQKDLGNAPSGKTLADGIRRLWDDLRVEEKIENDSRKDPGDPARAAAAIQKTLWDQLNGWLDNLVLAFEHESLPLSEWVQIVEAGLACQTVGLVPPAVDQVLVGAIDRSRNPDLRLAIILGLNEGVFPAIPAPRTLLNESDRDALESAGVPLRGSFRHQLARERYLAYVACTRSREKLLLTWSRRSNDDQALNPSAALAQIRALFPDLVPGRFQPPAPAFPSEAPAPTPRLLDLRLSPPLPDLLFGPELRTSITALEDYASCPFKFFVASGLKAAERRLFELDAKERGSFQHEILARLHAQLRDESKRWRDLAPGEGAARVRRIGDELALQFSGGLFTRDHTSRFAAQNLVRLLARFIEVAGAWFKTYQFDPEAVELPFGLDPAGLPEWRVELAPGRSLLLRGKIDRIDLLRRGDHAFCVVIDYKARDRAPDMLLCENGVQMQLPAYLRVLETTGAPQRFGVSALIPAGVFYVGLRGCFKRKGNRHDAATEQAAALRNAFVHRGYFSCEFASLLDTPDAPSGQFKYKRNKDGAYKPDAFTSDSFRQRLSSVDRNLERMGNAIFNGDISIAPFKKGKVTACGKCDFQPICRFQSWTDPYRRLYSPGADAATT